MRPHKSKRVLSIQRTFVDKSVNRRSKEKQIANKYKIRHTITKKSHIVRTISSPFHTHIIYNPVASAATHIVSTSKEHSLIRERERERESRDLRNMGRNSRRHKNKKKKSRKSKDEWLNFNSESAVRNTKAYVVL